MLKLSKLALIVFEFSTKKSIRNIKKHCICNKTRLGWVSSDYNIIAYSVKLFMTSTSFVFTELANTMKYGGGFLDNLVFTEGRHCVSQNEV